MTTDGGPDERKAAEELVGEDNQIYCCAHLIQLAIDDVLNRSRDNAPALCHRHRALVIKMHQLVVYILTHRLVLDSFTELARQKRDTEIGSRNFSTLLKDNDTRWDSELAMIERVVYFDKEIQQLYEKHDDMPLDLVISNIEFDLAYAMIRILQPFRHFTKYVQHAKIATLYQVPRLIDQLVCPFTMDQLQEMLTDRHPTTVDLAINFQQCLVEATKTRFEPMFGRTSLALAALMLSPGSGRFQFQHSIMTEEILESVLERLIDEAIVLRNNATDEQKYRALVRATFEVV